MDDEPRHQLVVAVVGFGIVLSFVYSIVITAEILIWLSVVSILLLFYLLWRLVRAHEQIADALDNNE